MAVDVPPDRNPGDDGHITDHNLLNESLSTLSDSVDALTALSSNVPIFCQATAPTNPVDGAVWLDRTAKAVKVWNAASTTWESF